jgi:hypothetical protein
MGQIVIDIPLNTNMRFEIESKHEYAALMKLLDSFSIEQNLTEEDLEDIRLSNIALAEGEFITLEEAKKYWDR